MYENPGRYLTLTLVLLLGAVASMVIPDRPFRLGLDLQGGTRLAYKLDFEKALAEGKISQAEFADRQQLLRDTSEIFRSRVDPQGILEASFRPEGDDRIVIELPGGASLSRAQASGKLGSELAADGATLELDAEDDMLRNFPANGGVVGVSGEKIRYGRRDGRTLADLVRGLDSTPAGLHPAGASVELLSDDAIRILIENTGEMQFFIRAKPGDYPAGTDETVERNKVTEWMRANPDVPLAQFDRLPTDRGGPAQGIRWYPMRIRSGEVETPLGMRDIQPLVLPPPEWRFSGDDLDSVHLSQDQLGYPAVAFELKPSKRAAFGDFTGAHVNDGMAIVLNDEIATLATINERLPGQGIISGGTKGFTLQEVKDLITVLRSGSLRIKPELQQEERVGATLGDDYVRKGVISSALSLLLVCVFMILYYRRLGWFASITLAVNLFLLLGVMAFLRATLTLPGIAGLILTVGMAVDSNILIYERIREETARGLKLAQAAKNGFERAFLTIFDTNITTLLSGIILYKFGTGPVRGYATTLIVGILTSLFTVLVVTRLLVHFALLRGVKEFRMTQWVTQTKIRFMSMARPTITASAVLIALGVGLFIYLPDRDKLGIDFLGGFTLTVRTEEPQKVETIRSLVGGIEGSIGRTADVKAVLGSSRGADGFTEFRVTYKFAGDESADEGAEASGVEEIGVRSIRDALASVLQDEPVQLEVTPAETGSRIAGQLTFEKPHPTEELVASLADLGLRDVAVEPVQDAANRFAAYRITATSTEERTAPELTAVVKHRFDEALANPIPEKSSVGAQVSGELRDKAVLAVLLSLFVTVLYIRVRFKEYSYGIAIVVALIHDVLMALGALAFATYTGWIEAEINLAMIAAFLTIIGFSQNDTIVIFDRVRENLPRVKGSLEEILDLSINQTLSRTILTSGTVFITLVVLFAFNVGTRNVLEGFTFAMLIGVIAGTYSTVFIASPVLLWMERRSAAKVVSSDAKAA